MKKQPGKKHEPARKRRLRTRHKGGQVGAPPGRFTVAPDALPPAMSMFVYGVDRCEDRAITDPAEAAAARGDGVVWLDVQGTGDADVLRRIGQLFDLHPLALEDTAHMHQRAKVDHYPQHLFVVVHMVQSVGEGIGTEQVSLYIGPGYVITFQERAGDAFEPVRERLRKGYGLIRARPADYLAYALIDATVDAYFPMLEALGDRAERIEDDVLGDPEESVVLEIQQIRRDLSLFRRSVWPLREALQTMSRPEVDAFVDPDTLPFLRDTMDHVLRVLDLIESYRELAAGLMDVYLSSVSNRMNENMQVLSVVATIFIPLTFIAGVYGMNFDPEVSPLNMPETKWYLGYPFSLVLMFLVGVGLFFFFRKKGWIRARRQRRMRAERERP